MWLSISNKGAGAFFFQKRPGKDERLFKVIKFKTMTDELDLVECHQQGAEICHQCVG